MISVDNWSWLARTALRLAVCGAWPAVASAQFTTSSTGGKIEPRQIEGDEAARLLSTMKSSSANAKAMGPQRFPSTGPLTIERARQAALVRDRIAAIRKASPKLRFDSDEAVSLDSVMAAWARDFRTIPALAGAAKQAGIPASQYIGDSYRLQLAWTEVFRAHARANGDTTIAGGRITGAWDDDMSFVRRNEDELARMGWTPTPPARLPLTGAAVVMPVIPAPAK